MGCAFPAVSKGFPLDLNFEFGIIIGMVDASSWRNHDFLLGDGLAVHKRVVGESVGVTVLDGRTPLHFQFAVVKKG